MKHVGNLEITEANRNDFKELVEVTGYLNVYTNGKLDAPKLTTIGGHLYVNAKLAAPELTTVGGYLSVYAKLDAPVLTTVGGYLSVHANAQLEAPILKANVKSAKETCDSALEQAFAAHGLIKIDNILSWLISKKTLKDVTVFEIKIVGKLTNSYAVKRGDVYSHGETVEQAIADLRYKISSRDTSEFKNWDVSLDRTSDECIKAYRVITGACEQGVRDFCKSMDLEKKYSLQEIFKITEGKFGSQEFVKFFKGELK